MPPTGPLDPEQLNIIKLWIDQGAKWPDELAGETAAAPPDPKAARMMELLRDGDRRAFETMLSEDPRVASRIGPGGSTPLMYAVLYGDADAVGALLGNGADPNARNEAGASALMWAVDDLEKTRLLLERGAEVNARPEAIPDDCASRPIARKSRSRVKTIRPNRVARARRTWSSASACPSSNAVSTSMPRLRRPSVIAAGT